MGAEIKNKETVYAGRIFDVVKADISMNGKEFMREIIEHKGSGVVVPVFDDLTVALVRQFRHPAGKELLEIPAGRLDKGEVPIDGAARELEEEIGYRAEKLEKLSEFYVSPGFLQEKMYLFLATGLKKTEQSLDFDEFVEVERYTFPQLLQMIADGEIEDAKTIIGITSAAANLSMLK